jgi:predicted transcriptional regulator
MKDNIKEVEDGILNYLYENRTASPQSVAKIKFGINLGKGKGDIRVFKSSLDSLITKKFVKKQEDRGNYKINTNGIEFIEGITQDIIEES